MSEVELSGRCNLEVGTGLRQRLEDSRIGVALDRVADLDLPIERRLQALIRGADTSEVKKQKRGRRIDQGELERP